MRPVSHPSNTRTLGAPAGWDQSGLPVEPLGITDQVLEGVPCVWSFWRPDAEELAALNAGGHVVLSIVGRNMPPAAVMVTAPEAPMPIADQLAAARIDCQHDKGTQAFGEYFYCTKCGSQIHQAELDSIETGEGDAR